MRRTLATMILGACGGFLLLAPTAAHADNSIVSSSPENGAELATQPTEIVTTFENPIGSSTAVIVCDNDPFTGYGDATVSSDSRTVTIPLTAAMAGECVVSFTLTNTDGEEDARVSFSFTVAAAAATGATTPAGTTADGGTVAPASGSTSANTAGDSGDEEVSNASSVSSAPVWLGRVLSIVGLSVLFGSLVLIVAAWPEGPEYVLALRFLRSAWILGLVGTLIYVSALAAAVNGDSFGSGLNPGSWFDLFDAGWAGRAAVMRVVFAAACGWVVLKPERVIDPTTNMLALGIPALAVVTLGLSRTGGSLAFLGVLASIVHVLAMAVWFGGVVLIARVVLAGPGEEDLVHAVRGFGRISNPAIIATVVSGLIQVYRQVSASDLFGTGHGRVFLLKTLAVAAMLFVGLTARQIARAKLTRAGELSIKTADRLRRAFGTEAAIGLIVIALTGWLLALNPGKVDEGELPDGFVDPATVEVDALDFEIEVSVRPGRIGLNDLRVVVTRPESGLSGLVLRFIPPEGSNGTSFEQPIELAGEGLAASGEGGGVPLDVGGRWRVEVSANTPQGSVPPTNLFLDIRDADGNLPPVGNANLPDPPNTASTAPPATAAPTSAPETTDATETTEG
jgi:putative copper export protein/methionine-rich copper-binding protein CopC